MVCMPYLVRLHEFVLKPILKYSAVMTEFFRSFKPKVMDDVFRRLITMIMNSCKSSNPSTLLNAVALLQVLLDTQPRRGK